MHRAETQRTRRERPCAPNGAYRTQTPGRQAPESCLFFAPWRLRVKLFPGPSGKPANPRPTTHVPFPTSTRLCHKARGCAGRRTTPGPGHITFPTPKGVVPSFRLGTTPREHHGTYLSHRDAKHPNPISSPRLRVSARDFFRVPRKGMYHAEPRRTQRERPYAPNGGYRAQSPGCRPAKSFFFFAPWRLRVRLFPGPIFTRFITP